MTHFRRALHHPSPARASSSDAASASFAFAFDNPAFADRLLCVRLLPDLPSAGPSSSSTLHQPFAQRSTLHPSGKTVKSSGSANNDCHHDSDDIEAGLLQQGQQQQQKKVEEENDAAVLRIHVNSLLLAGRSRFFLSLFSAGMIETSQKEVWLSVHEEEKDALLDVLGFLYRGSFLSLNFDHLLKVLLLSDKYDVPMTLEAASQAIQACELTPLQCEVLLELESHLPENPAFGPVVARGRDLLEAAFAQLDDWWALDAWTLVGPHAMRLLLGSPNTRVTSENTTFALLEKWLSVDWPGRQRYIPELAPLIRWSTMDVNYLADVVRRCTWLMQFDWFQTLFMEATMWQAFPTTRKSFILSTDDGARFVPRPEPLQPVRSLKIEWELDVSELAAKGAKQIDSPSYQHKGYYFALQLCREKATDREGSAVGLYVFANAGPLVRAEVDGGGSGEQQLPCFLPVQSQITVRNPVTREAQSVGTTDYYTNLNTAWGWKDFLRPFSWEDLLAKRCHFVAPHQGSLALSAIIHLPHHQ